MEVRCLLVRIPGSLWVEQSLGQVRAQVLRLFGTISPEKGTLRVTTSNCSPTGENGSTVTNSYTRHSVFGLAWPTTGTCNSVLNKEIPLCNPGVATLCVDPLYVAGTGGAGEPARKEVDRYIFSIPAGWRGNGTHNGPTQISQTTRSITLEPLPGTNTGTTISVFGSVSNTCGGTHNSPPFNITINRTPVKVEPPVGFTGLTCGQKAPIIFRATALSCATNYAWTFPSDWTGSSTGQAITLTPSGKIGGNVNVNITSYMRFGVRYVFRSLYRYSPSTDRIDDRRDL